MTIIRVSIATVARVPHVIAEGLHLVAPRLRSRYTVHVVAVSIMGVGFHMDHTEHAAIEWITHHAPRLLSILAEMGWKPFSELLSGIGLAPYLDGSARRVFNAIKPADEKEKE